MSEKTVYENWASLLAAKALRAQNDGHLPQCPGYRVIGRHTYREFDKCDCGAHQLNLAYERACDDIADRKYANFGRGFSKS